MLLNQITEPEYFQETASILDKLSLADALGYLLLAITALVFLVMIIRKKHEYYKYHKKYPF